MWSESVVNSFWRSADFASVGFRVSFSQASSAGEGVRGAASEVPAVLVFSLTSTTTLELGVSLSVIELPLARISRANFRKIVYGKVGWRARCEIGLVERTDARKHRSCSTQRRRTRRERI